MLDKNKNVLRGFPKSYHPEPNPSPSQIVEFISLFDYPQL